MHRSQILITPEIDKEIKKISKQQNISQSETVRKLLTMALGTSQKELGEIPTNLEKQIYTLESFLPDNQRIGGFKEIFSVGGRTIEIKILGDEVFRYYQDTGKFPNNFEYQLEKIADELGEMSLVNSLSVRRAYVVPGLENPPGPRFLGVEVKKVLGAVKEIYDFAIEHEYHVKEGSQIVVFLHPFVDPKPLTLPIKMGISLPYGGYSAPLNQEASRVEVFAVWGNNEGVQSLDAIDRYTVDTERWIVMTKDIPQKSVMMCTTKKSQVEKIMVPADRQFEQVLSDGEILEVARVVKELTIKYGLRRVEFSYDGKEGIVFNEAAKYEIVEKNMTRMDKKGVIKVVSGEKEIESLKQLSEADIAKTIVYIDKKIVENRAYDLLNNIAGLPKKFTMLYPGLSATAHAMRVLNDFGHTAVVVGNRVFINGQEILVKMENGQVRIEDLTRSRVKNQLINLYDARLFGIELVGGKANNLSLLKTKGFNVPHGWVITTKFWERMQKNDKNGFVKKWKEIAVNLPLEIKKKYAIRSSATEEDKLEHSFAGQFSTFLNVKKEEAEEKVWEVLKSAENKQVVTYLTALGKNKPIKMAVVVQEMVEVSKSGVVFGKDIQTDDNDLMVIDAAKGLGEGVVDGVAKTQRIIYSRNKDKVIKSDDGEAKSVLDKVEISSLIEMAFSVERMMGRTQDIEWAIDKKNNIWLVQSRDL